MGQIHQQTHCFRGVLNANLTVANFPRRLNRVFFARTHARMPGTFRQAASMLCALQLTYVRDVVVHYITNISTHATCHAGLVAFGVCVCTNERMRTPPASGVAKSAKSYARNQLTA